MAERARRRRGDGDPGLRRPGEWILKEGNLPENVTPENSKLKDPEERARIARVFERGLTEPSGYVLPIQRWQAKASTRRRSAKVTRRKPRRRRDGRDRAGAGNPRSGSCAAASCSSCRATARSAFACRSVAAVRAAGALSLCRSPPIPPCRAGRCRTYAAIAPEHRQRRSRSGACSARSGRDARQQDRSEQSLGEVAGAVRTAITVEPRDGRLCVFMPPVERLEDYLELIAAAEAAAKAMGLPVHIEGYAPPHDPRMNVIRVAPDPGVIEVNIHPATSWGECVAITTTLYEEARQTRLGADKFMIDGRHTGTGGGNHVVVGGGDADRQPVPAPARSAEEPDAALAAPPDAVLPVLRPVHRPDEPGAAHRRGAPRHALRARDRAGADPAAGRGRRPPPWLVDRLLRNLLIDVTGNTHRDRDLHRQALLARRPHRPAGPGRVPRLRDAARRRA